MKPALQKKGLRLAQLSPPYPSFQDISEDETCPTEKGIATWNLKNSCLQMSLSRMKPALHKKGLRQGYIPSLYPSKKGKMKPAL